MNDDWSRTFQAISVVVFLIKELLIPTQAPKLYPTTRTFSAPWGQDRESINAIEQGRDIDHAHELPSVRR